MQWLCKKNEKAAAIAHATPRVNPKIEGRGPVPDFARRPRGLPSLIPWSRGSTIPRFTDSRGF